MKKWNAGVTIGNPVAPKLRRSRHRQRGASLLEAIAYLGIAAIVVIGAVALLNSAFNSAGTNQLSEQVSAIQTGVKKLYMGQSTGYTDVSNAVLQSAGVFPSTVSVTGSGTSATATNNWGGAVSVTGTATSFSIEYDNVPASVCVNAVVSGGSWSSIQIGGTTETTLPISPAKAATDCGASGSTTITWTSV